MERLYETAVADRHVMQLHITFLVIRKKWVIIRKVLLQNGGFCNNYTPKRCISKQMHYKTLFLNNGYIKSLEFNENYITLFWLEKKNFDNIILTQNHTWQITRSDRNNYLV